MRRVDTSAGVFKVSKAGFDVTTAGAADLLLDTIGQKYQGAFHTGLILNSALSGPVVSTNVIANDTSTWTYTLNFGRTYPHPPQILFGANGGGYDSGNSFLPFYRANSDAASPVEKAVFIDLAEVTI